MIDIAEASPKEFFNSIDFDKIDVNNANIANHILYFMDQPEFQQADDLGDVKEFKMLKELILTEMPYIIKGYESQPPLEQPPAEVEPVQVATVVEDIPAKIAVLKGRLTLIPKMMEKGKMDKTIGETRLKIIRKMLAKAEAQLPKEEVQEVVAPSLEPESTLPEAPVSSKEEELTETPSLAPTEPAPSSKPTEAATADDESEIELTTKTNKQAARDYIADAKRTNPTGVYDFRPNGAGRYKVVMKMAEGGHVSTPVPMLYFGINKKGVKNWNNVPHEEHPNLTWKAAHDKAAELAKHHNAEVRVSKWKEAIKPATFFLPESNYANGGALQEAVQAKKVKVLVSGPGNKLGIQMKNLSKGQPYKLEQVKTKDGKAVDKFYLNETTGKGYIVFTKAALADMDVQEAFDELYFYKNRYGIKNIDATTLIRFFGIN